MKIAEILGENHLMFNYGVHGEAPVRKKNEIYKKIVLLLLKPLEIKYIKKF